jgi:N-6 DNA Methylase
MAIRSFLLFVKQKIGVVYTPLEWAEWAIQDCGAYEAWLNNAKIVDPTVGEGVFIEAFLSLAIKSKIKITRKMVDSLFGFDIREEGIENFSERISLKYDIKLKEKNFLVKDILLDDCDLKFDYAVGNPPWVNFNNLPDNYKEVLKSKFHEYQLISNSGSVLLGKSRVDIAALVVNVVVSKCLKAKGKLAMFLPSSLFFGGAAHNEFRKFHSKDIPYQLLKLYDFGNRPIFDSSNQHGTAFCFAEFDLDTSNAKPTFAFKLNSDNSWKSQNLIVAKEKDNSYVRVDSNGEFSKITVSKKSKTRQGLNAGGRNNLFFGEIIEGSLDDEIVTFKNLDDEIFQLETKFIYPLVMRDNLKFGVKEPVRYAIICHDELTGKAVEEAILRKFPLTHKYIESKKTYLVSRKGVLINVNISKGIYWGLLGVGKYSFAPYKLIWLTAGQTEWAPEFISKYKGKSWQANQSLQAFMPFDSENDAVAILESIKNLASEVDSDYLGTKGTLGWAQPGRVNAFFNFI